MAGVTMTMVAREARVSVSTVSHVVNGTRPVNADTRRAVLEAMERLGFRARPVAGSLAAGSTLTIGLVAGLAVNPALRELAQGIDEEASRRGAQILMVDNHEDPHHEARVVASLLAHHIDALLIAPAQDWEDTTLRLLRDRAVPYLLLDRLQDVRADQVGVENESATATLVDHLLQRGHRRIAYVGGRRFLSTCRERRLGFDEAYRRRGLTPAPELVLTGLEDEEQARRAVGGLLTLPQRPTGLFAANAGLAIGALRAIRSAGLSVPDDIAVVAFEDLPWADIAEPSLTVVAQPSYALGARAVQMVLRRLVDPDVPHQTLRLAGEILHRRSCGCEPRAKG